MILAIEKWDDLKRWLPEDPKAPITDAFLKGLGFGCNENGALDDATKEFIESITDDLDQICTNRGYGPKVYALSFDEGPASYPDVQDDCGGGQHHQHYFDLLSEAQRECMEGVFEYSSPLEDYGTRFHGFLEHFGTYDRREHKPPRRPKLEPNWHQFNQSSTIYLYSDWEAGFWDLSKETLDESVWGQLGEDKFGYGSSWDAFRGQYIELLGIALMQWWLEIQCGPESLMSQWRGSLGRHIGARIEDTLDDLAEVAILDKVLVTYVCNKALKPTHFPTLVMGWTNPCEFASDADWKCEMVPELNRACVALRRHVVEFIAEALRREEDCVVITTSGDPVTYKDNGRTQERIAIKKFLRERLKQYPDVTFDDAQALKRDPVLRPLARIFNDAARMGDPKESAEHFITMVKDLTNYDREDK